MATMIPFPEDSRIRVNVAYRPEKVSGYRHDLDGLVRETEAAIEFAFTTQATGHWKEQKTIASSKDAPCCSMTAYERVQGMFPRATDPPVPVFKVMRIVYVDISALRQVLLPEDGPNLVPCREAWSKGLLGAHVVDNVRPTEEDIAAIDSAVRCAAGRVKQIEPLAQGSDDDSDVPRSVFDPRGYSAAADGTVPVEAVAFGGSRVMYSKFTLPLLSDREWLVDESYVRVRHRSEVLRRALLFGGLVRGDPRGDSATAAAVATGRGPARPVSPTDAHSALETAPLETLFIVAKSTAHPAQEEDGSTVRGTVFHTSWAITHHPAIPNRCVLSQVVASDPGGVVSSLPGFIVRNQMQSYLAEMLEAVASAAACRVGDDGRCPPEPCPDGCELSPTTPRESFAAVDAGAAEPAGTAGEPSAADADTADPAACPE